MMGSTNVSMWSHLKLLFELKYPMVLEIDVNEISSRALIACAICLPLVDGDFNNQHPCEWCEDG